MSCWLAHPSTHALLMLLASLLCYSNTFNVPFLFDDYAYIEQNPIIRNLDSVLDPELVDEHVIPNNVQATMHTRTVGYMTFWINYALGGTDVTGYHLFNLAIHYANALLLYALTVMTFNSPRLRGRTGDETARTGALFVAMLFVTHPLMTQAVTYVTQRFASLGTFFFLLAMASYAGSRLAPDDSVIRRRILYGLSIAAAFVGMKTKENCFTIPVVIALYEYMFFDGTVRRRLVRLVPFALSMLVLPFNIMFYGLPDADTTSLMPSNNPNLPRWKYLLVETRVVVTYLRLLLLPINQNFYYDYFHPTLQFIAGMIASAVAVSALFAMTVRAVWRSWRLKVWIIPAIYGMAWFFVTLSVESSIIPQGDVIQEYRMYLPSGVMIMGVVISAILFSTDRARLKALALAGAVAVLALGAGTYARNEVYQSRVSLWSDVVRKSPGLGRAHSSLAESYFFAGREEEAFREFQEAVRLEPRFTPAHNNLGKMYMQMGLKNEAASEFEAAIAIRPDYDEHNQLGKLYDSMGLLEKSVEQQEKAVALWPGNPQLRTDLGLAYEKLGRYDEARREYEQALAIDPSFDQAARSLSALPRQK